MNTKSTDVGTGFTADPEYAKMSVFVVFEDFGGVDCSNPELTFDGGDERWTLEECTG
jgi:hypothetical protein